MNKIIVIGHLGRDPEMRYTPTGQSVTSFSVASSHKYNGQEYTEWFNVSAFGKLAELTNEYLTRGKQVYIEGRLRSRSYEARDGTTRFVNEINLSDVQFLGQKQQASQQDDSPIFEDDSNLPF